ncbi:MAG: 2-oxoacid:acceptor oxidoreductase subunit alpha [Candidatus Eisenbacteria bacterium]
MDRTEYDRVIKAIGKKRLFAQGDEAYAFGALLAGCRFFAGYPITPATESAEVMSQLLPRIGGAYVQMEDEIASMGAIIGASLAGVKSMTVTSGPGFSLMQENIGYAFMTETPCVVVNVQRSGPSTGQPTEPSQGDIMQAKWGSHGDYEIIALSPNSVQESLDLTIECFNLAEKYRNPVLLMTDGEVGHMREGITIPDHGEYEIIERTRPSKAPADYIPFLPESGKIPRLADFGTGYHTYYTGLTHKPSGLPSTDDAEIHTQLIRRLCGKISDDTEKLTRVEELYLDDADSVIVSYGITSRAAAYAAKMLRAEGRKVGYLRLVTIWPFPEKVLQRLGESVKKIVVPEMNLGQIYHKVREAVGHNAEVIKLPKIGGIMHSPQEIAAALKE